MGETQRITRNLQHHRHHSLLGGSRFRLRRPRGPPRWPRHIHFTPCNHEDEGSLQLRGGVEKPSGPRFDCPLLSAHPSPLDIPLQFLATSCDLAPGTTENCRQDDHSQVANDVCCGGMSFWLEPPIGVGEWSVPGLSRSPEQQRPTYCPPSTHSSSSLPLQCNWSKKIPR